MPTVDLPGMRSMSTDSAFIARHRSSARPVTLLYFTPASGLNSKVVTTGPGWICTTAPSTANSRHFSSSCRADVHQLALVDLALGLGRVEQRRRRQREGALAALGRRAADRLGLGQRQRRRAPAARRRGGGRLRAPAAAGARRVGCGRRSASAAAAAAGRAVARRRRRLRPLPGAARVGAAAPSLRRASPARRGAACTPAALVEPGAWPRAAAPSAPRAASSTPPRTGGRTTPASSA